jgi:uncharacterized protein YdiU (UPF0061 family)
MEGLKLRNDFFEGLPGEPLEQGTSTLSRQTPGVLFCEVIPEPVRSPSVLITSSETLELCGLPADFPSRPEFASVFSGNQIPAGARPMATRYGGHQFGHWAGQLGDGRALSLGELPGKDGKLLELQLKGAGRTPYSRRADGRAVLRSSLREYLCSEAMHALGIPTTRALSCVLTGDAVVRDLFYDGNPAPEPGAITTRVARSFLRLGHFQILAASGEIELLQRLLTRTLDRLFPELRESGVTPSDAHPTEGEITRFFAEVCTRTARLMADWLRVGFVHGVMNTDNLSILGLTIDYGPYGWLDVYDPTWTPNTTDETHRRYRFGNQPGIALWNLTRFAEALLPLYGDEARAQSSLQQGLETYRRVFRDTYLRHSTHKLGLSLRSEAEVIPLLEALESTLTLAEIDPTLFYRHLSSALGELPDRPVEHEESLLRAIRPAFYSENLSEEAGRAWHDWLSRFLALSTGSPSSLDRLQLRNQQAEMDQANPFFILRNYLVQEALDSLEKGDRSVLDRLSQALRTPYERNALTEGFFKKRPEWARTRPGCAALSCSS